MQTLTYDELKKIDGYFRAANYLSVGQLYLLDNPLLRRPLSINDIKPNVVAIGVLLRDKILYMFI